MRRSTTYATPDPTQADELRQMIAAGETSDVELKINPPRPNELAYRIAGLANRRFGGVVLLGVEEATRTLAGVKDVQQAIDIIEDALRLIHPPMTQAPPRTQVWKLDDAILVVVEIPANPGVLYQAGGTFPIRKGTKTYPMNACCCSGSTPNYTSRTRKLHASATPTIWAPANTWIARTFSARSPS